jgi:hypothetical protein
MVDPDHVILILLHNDNSMSNTTLYIQHVLITKNLAMVTFMELPQEIRDMILYHALPGLGASQPVCSVHADLTKCFHAENFYCMRKCRRAVLCIATTSRPLMTDVLCLIRLREPKLWLPAHTVYMKHNGCIQAVCRACAMSKWYFLFRMRKALNRVVMCSTWGVTSPGGSRTYSTSINNTDQ